MSPVFPAHRFSIAPMLDWTGPTRRYSPAAAVAAYAAVYRNGDHGGDYSRQKVTIWPIAKKKHPVACRQLGGS
ncbi:hypothetical protein LNP17_02165 [Klebsiella variicola subsp. variicola]|nr:hypothetical protein [Klebsiella variicola subsp. variicola]